MLNKCDLPHPLSILGRNLFSKNTVYETSLQHCLGWERERDGLYVQYSFIHFLLNSGCNFVLSNAHLSLVGAYLYIKRRRQGNSYTIN